jgi:ketosteroid isomerase-like protein
MDQERVQDFFLDYSKALSSGDEASVARFWMVPALVVGEGRTIPVAAPSEVEAFFQQSIGHYRASGIQAATLGDSEVRVLSDSTAAAYIHWDHEDAAGNRVGGEDAFYVVARDAEGGEFRIVFYTPITG